jgi:hypothetical protein
MSEAPERIWADGNAEWDSGSWGLDKEFDNDVEYVRADRIEELEGKLTKAVEALEEIAKPKVGPDFDWPDDEADRWRAGWYRKYGDNARAALAELKGEDRG